MLLMIDKQHRLLVVFVGVYASLSIPLFQRVSRSLASMASIGIYG